MVTTATLLLAGCGHGSAAVVATTLTTPSDLPAKSSLSTDLTVVPAGRWGVVRASVNATTKSVDGAADLFAIQVVGLVKGSPGDLKDNQILNGSGGVDMATAVPYYLAYRYSVLAGDPADSPVQQLSLAAGAGSDGFTTLLINQDYDKCAPPADHDNYPSTFGPSRTGCTIAVTNGNDAPTTLVYDSNGGSHDVQFAVGRQPTA